METNEIAAEYYQYGLCTFPVGTDKLPYKRAKWKDRQQKLLKPVVTDAPALAIVCGKGSGNIEIVDIDTKFDLTGELWNNYKKQIQHMMPGLLEKLVVQKTVGGGYHFIYRCKEIEGNQKLASRLANEEEKKSGEKQKVLIETRGQGGYFLIYPSPGYVVIHGTLKEVTTLTTVERSTLLNAARYFDEIKKNDKTPLKETQPDELSPFTDYNERIDLVSYLISKGWTEQHTNGENVHLKRPGKKDKGCSATYHKTSRWLYVFSTSTEFDAPAHYKPAEVFCKTECNGDWSAASKMLRGMGYGSHEKVPQKKTEILNYIEDLSKIYEWVEIARQGKQKMGLPTCIETLNRYYLYKENTFDVINGHDNVGKTLILIFLAVDSARNHGWRWIIWPAENNPGFIFKKIMEFYMRQPVHDMNALDMKKARDWTNEHFTILSNHAIYSHDEIITIGQKCFKRRKYNGFLVDPYNALRIDLKGYGKLSTHEYHYEITSKMRQFSSEYCSLFLNCHAVTEALRKTDKDKYPVAPHKSDTEGGGKFSNRADNFLTIHRKTQHPTDWRITEIHVRKIKEQETGGRPSPLDDPVKLEMVKGGCDFIEYTDESKTEYNPDQHIEPIKAEDIPF